MDLVCVTIDCRDPAAVANFWNDALRCDAVQVHPDGAGAVCFPAAQGVYVEFVQVPETKTIKNRVHLGCSAGELDRLDDEIARLQELGATVAWEEEFPSDIAAVYRNVVLRDVEGNEFCLGAGTLPSTEVHTCAARGDDRVVVLDLSERLTETTPAWRDRAATAQAIRTSIADLLDSPHPDHGAFVAELEGTVVGFVSVSEREHFTGATDASIDDLMVSTKAAGRGVGAALIKAAEAWARKRQLERVTVETGARNRRALRLYRRCGYRDEDVRLTKQI